MEPYPIKSPRKLIEVALPLDAISAGCEQEKNPFLKGHPRSVHLWWARRPLAAARAVIFAQLVNDPGYQQGSGFKYGRNRKEAAIERKRLFGIIEDLVQWDNIKNEKVMEAAREEIRRSWREVCALNRDHPQAAELFDPDKLPALHDPFAGGGTIPLEAQRLGLEAYASDLNPVAVVINTALIEVPPKFAGLRPVARLPKSMQPTLMEQPQAWPGSTGLAEDVRRYGTWLCDQAQKRIGHLYPPVEITAEMAVGRPDLKPLIGKKLSVIAWLWVRTVKSPNPAFSHVDVPLASSFILSNKKGKEAYVEPEVEGSSYRFKIKIGKPPAKALDGTKTGKAQDFYCLVSNVPISRSYVSEEGKAGRLGIRLLSIVADGPRGRVYLPPNREIEKIPLSSEQLAQVADARNGFLSGATPTRAMITGGVCSAYLVRWGDLFSSRQLVALMTLSDLIADARKIVCQDATAAGMPNDGVSLASGGTGATAYSEAISMYLATGISQLSRYSCGICAWNKTNENVAQAFGRQALQMVWDFAESHPLVGSLSIQTTVGWVASAIDSPRLAGMGNAIQADAQSQQLSSGKFVSTDPPYYDNIAYAELADFFYPWLRRGLVSVFPSLFSTISVPKAEELVATRYRHGSKEKADIFFLDGMTHAMEGLAQQAHPAAPVTIYYAFKQSESQADKGTSSTGWASFLSAVLKAGFQLTGTWPIRTERTEGLKGKFNSLASSIILVCRKRSIDAPTISRREFIRELDGVLPGALDEMTKGAGGEHSPVAPVDLSQAIIGPGMAVFSKYAGVLEADGSPMSVRTALQVINRFLAEDDFDADTQFCLHWFEQHGWAEGIFGSADTLARAKGTSVDGVKEAGVVRSGGGKVRLLKWSEYPTNWDPRTDTRTPVWEALHQLIRAFRQGGDSASGALLAALDGKAEAVRQLAYRLYTLCERVGQAEDARAYNELITGWSGIETAAGAVTGDRDLFGDSV
jgi:putative DNA methylase